MDIGKSIRIAMALDNLKAKEVCEHAKISQEHLCQLRSNKRNPSMNKLRDLAFTFQMKVSEFIALGESTDAHEKLIGESK